MYTQQANGATPEGLTNTERLPWFNDHVFALIGRRDEQGERVLQILHVEMLTALQSALPDREGIVTMPEAAAWLGNCHEATPRRLLGQLRRLGLVEYRPLETPGTVWIAAPMNRHDSNESPRFIESPRFQAAPARAPESCPCSICTAAAAKRACARENERSDESKPEGEPAKPTEKQRIPGEALGRLREIRRSLLGAARLTDLEMRRFSEIFAAGVEMPDVEEAVEQWQDRKAAGKAPAARSLLYLIPLADERAECRRLWNAPLVMNVPSPHSVGEASPTETTNGTDRRGDESRPAASGGRMERAARPARSNGRSDGRTRYAATADAAGLLPHQFTSPEQEERYAIQHAELMERYFPGSAARRAAGEGL